MIIVRGQKLEKSGMMTIVQVHHQQATRVCLSGIPRNINVVSSVSAPTSKISNRNFNFKGTVPQYQRLYRADSQVWLLKLFTQIFSTAGALVVVTV